MQFPANTPLYRRILGARFEVLPAVLRRFHDTGSGGRASGIFQVKRAPGRLRNAIAAVLRMPRAGDAVPVTLRVAVEGDRERWTRDFAGHRVETIQWARGDLLMEARGLVHFSTDLVLEGSRLTYRFRRAWVAGVPFPRWLSPGVVSHVEAGDDGWFVVVRVVAPFLGELVRYEGWIEPE
jgi:hypothetical protein